MTRLAFVLGLQFLAGAALAAPVKVWETTGFETPESALYDAADSRTVRNARRLKDKSHYKQKVPK